MDISNAESRARRREDDAFAIRAVMQTDVALAYQVNERLPAEPRSTSYRATRRTDGGRVLLKTPSATSQLERDAAEFAHENAVLVRLAGAPIINALALEQIEGRPWLVLDDADGQPLDAIASRFRGPERAIELAARIAGALAEVHRRGVVHRDLNPQHVIVLADGGVRLTGFRNASLLRVDASLTAFQGSPAYMAPEQTGRMNRSVDKRADLYALGIVLYELLTGRVPFEGKDLLEWTHAHLARLPIPPEQLDDRVPAAVSAIVLKLLSKQPEDRYHGAAGVQRDLERCAEALARGDRGPFALASDDSPDEFRVSHRLYGREVEVARLLAGLDRASSGGSAVVSLVFGYSGVGKTSIVGALYQPIVRQRGRFVSGKFDQYKRDIPYATLVQAFRDILREILASGESPLAEWREGLREALGANGRVIVDVIAELELIIGAQPPALALDPLAAQNRFDAAFVAFARVFARRDRPLVVFLDDMQWADGATLGVLKSLARPGEVPGLQLVLGYRDNEVDGTHPFQLALDSMAKSGAVLDAIPVGDLSPRHITQLVADAVSRSAADPALIELAQVICAKSRGNPFFINELLYGLDARGLLVFDVAARGWTWDKRAIAALEVTDNVVDLLVSRLRQLPAATQRALAVASCFGSRFLLGTLAPVLDLAPKAAASALFAALEEAFITTIGDGLGEEQIFRFQHDRIQQAAYSLLAEDERARVHLRIGRTLRSRLAANKPDATVFDVVKHLNQAVALIGERGERQALVELNLAAGQRAKTAVAWEPAWHFLETARALLAADAWTAEYATTFAVMRELAECEFLTGRFTSSEQRFEELRGRASSRASRAEVGTLQIRLHVLTGHYDDALALGATELEAFGDTLPATEAGVADAIAAQRRQIEARFATLDVHSIVDLPATPDADARALITLLASLPPAVYSRRPSLFPLLAMRIVNLSLEHGNCEASCFGYSLYAMVLAGMEGKTDRAFALSEASIALNERFGDPRLLGTVLHVHANHILCWARPYADASPLQERAYVACMNVGDLTIASYVSFMGAWQVIERGEPLAVAQKALDQFDDFAQRSRHESGHAAVRAQLQFLRALAGQTKGATSLTDDTVDGDALRDQMARAGFDTGLVMHDLLRAMLAWNHGRFTEAEAWLKRGAESLPAAFCLPLETTWTLVDALTASAGWDEADAALRPALLERVERAEARLARWAEGCPANFGAKHALVAAELARLQGRLIDAVRGYERAAESARHAGSLPLEAAATQLAWRLANSAGLKRSARAWLGDDHQILQRWGANALIAALEAAHPELHTEPLAGIANAASPEQQFDVITAIKASQALSREVVVEDLTEIFLRAVLENAGAQRAVILLLRGGRLEPAGTAAVNGASAPASALPLSVVKYVERTLRTVVLADAAKEPTFAADAYLTQTAARSVLCMPILARAELVGVLYLENKLAAGAFSEGRLALLEVLATQLAISLENARIYQERSDRAAEAARHEAIQWSERRYRETVEAIGDAFAAVDRNWSFIDVNKNYERRSQRSRQELLGKNLWEEFPRAKDPESRFWREYHRAMDERVEAHFVEYYAPLDHWSEIDVVPTSDGGIAFFLRDVSERKRTEAQKEQLLARELAARQLAESSSRVKDEFLAMLGHELRNPLAPIVTALHLMRLRAGGVAERERTIIERQVDHLVRLVDDLLDVSRITSGKVELRKKQIELGAAVATAIELASPLLERRKHHLTVTVPALGLVVNADSSRLAQVIANLLTNAAKYTEPGGQVSVAAARDGGEVVLRVRDSGTGISAEMLPKVFDLFVQERQSLDRSQGGLGLGLTIVRSLVALHGGTVAAESRGRGQGSEFTIRLPLVAMEGAPPSAVPPTSAPVAPTELEEGRRILVVDDNEDAADMLAESLSDAGYVTRIAHDGPAALRVAKEFAPEVALIDIGLPVMDGYELARHLRAPGSPPIRLIAITGYGQDSDRAASRLAGFEAHLVKPVALESVETLIEELLAGAAAVPEATLIT